ncbi:MAG TPA: response regulator transcription factor [Acidimicrobiales bacterium]|nr:response regulator transcription factor [Acidimicrobiales bacterium]
MTARVFIVDDHPLVRSGVRTELGDAVSVVGEAGDVDEAVKGLLALDDDALDVVLLDVHMPGGGGVEILRRVAPKKPALRFLALSVSDAPEDVIAVIRAGARGYITKSATGAEIAEAIERIAAGDAAFSPRLAGFVLDAFSSGVPASVAEAPVDAELEQLTPREREVLQLIARGYAYKEVGRRLNVSVKTVETHVSSVLRKLQLSSRHELARWATDRRLI